MSNKPGKKMRRDVGLDPPRTITPTKVSDEHPARSWRSQIAVGLVVAVITAAISMNSSYWGLEVIFCCLAAAYCASVLTAELRDLVSAGGGLRSWLYELHSDARVVLMCIGLLLGIGVMTCFLPQHESSSPTVVVNGQHNTGVHNGPTVYNVTNLIQDGPNYNGILLAPAGPGHRAIEIGDSGSILVQTDLSSQAFMAFSERDSLTVRSDNGRLKVSTDIHDRTGRLIAELVDNEWKMAPPPSTWDRNYTGDALEVRGDDGDVVLQIRVLANIVQLQGEWWNDSGEGLRIVSQGPKLGALFCPLWIGSQTTCPPIRPLFKYPSDTHLGQLVH